MKKNPFPQHCALIYQWDDPVWNAPASEEDGRRLFSAIMLRHLLDELSLANGHSGTPPINSNEENRMPHYVNSGNLKYDCEILGLPYDAVLSKIKKIQSREVRRVFYKKWLF